MKIVTSQGLVGFKGAKKDSEPACTLVTMNVANVSCTNLKDLLKNRLRILGSKLT